MTYRQMAQILAECIQTRCVLEHSGAECFSIGGDRSARASGDRVARALRSIPSARVTPWSGIAGRNSPIVEGAAKTQQGFESM
jgi:hypothetical protein